ncbi:putative phage tail protein [Paenibacillus campi]|uniref:putative phage tail protein n=1 Tax=Paenibacillus campi TaxID=3106031 RepID=UPI002B000B02|nr:putative phage tail protein [Paenibacillus sp. SGZ-1014]
MADATTNQFIPADADFFTSVKGAELFSYFPVYYDRSRVMRTDSERKGAEMDALYDALGDTFRQFFVRTATWGIERWEKELGIVPDVTKPLEQRRAVAESKLRGGGKFSGEQVKNVAAAYERGSVQITFQPSAWSFTITFLDTIGVPPNLSDLQATIEQIKPAHLLARYVFRYLRIKEIHNTMTIQQLQQRKMSDFAGGNVYVE